MKNIFTIFKKEWDRVIKDRRLILMVMVLPGLMIYLIYSFMGSAINTSVHERNEIVNVVNAPSAFLDIVESLDTNPNLIINAISTSNIDETKANIDAGQQDLLIVFDADFADYQNVGEKPGVTIYTNPNEIYSSNTYQKFQQYLQLYHSELSYELYGDTTYFQLTVDTTPINQEVISGQQMASLLPMLVIMFLFSGAMSIGPESIAGEKERNTIATLLITPVKRSEIALGKVFSLSLLSLISAMSSFLGIILSLPKLMQMNNFTGSIYSLNEYLLILGVLFSTVFVIIGVISIISCYARNLKEATTLILPVYLVAIVVSVSSLFGGSAPSTINYLIPIYNSVHSLSLILSFEADLFLPLFFTITSNIVYAVIFVYILNKMFQSEKIMFSK